MVNNKRREFEYLTHYHYLGKKHSEDGLCSYRMKTLEVQTRVKKG